MTTLKAEFAMNMPPSEGQFNKNLRQENPVKRLKVVSHQQPNAPRASAVWKTAAKRGGNGYSALTMSIVTRTGDDGTTGLMYNRRVSKRHPRVEAYGTVDELNAALGLARSASGQAWLREQLVGIQKDLVTVMGELATLEEDLPRYVKDGYAVVTPELTARLDALAAGIEAQNVPFKGWATPGANAAAAGLDLARTICRRAERQVCGLREDGKLNNGETVIFLNRLSDVLWLLARWAEANEGPVIVK
jgi:cob(I)alamin adenosyltransferase